MAILTRETGIKNITSKLAYIESYIRLSDSVNRYDINIAMETFSADLLNLIYDYELINENAENPEADRRYHFQVAGSMAEEKEQGTVSVNNQYSGTQPDRSSAECLFS